ncbi:MAG: N-acetylmuramoyl-L-alanine amidase [Planctomycetota bacterium]|jgi:N-acetylmuramoyl-L-alanine amidase
MSILRAAAFPILTLAFLSIAITSSCVAPTRSSSNSKAWTPGKSLAPAVSNSVVREATHVNRKGEEIVVAGEFIPIGVPVVLWTDRDGFDAYQDTATRANFAPGRPIMQKGLTKVDATARALDFNSVRQAVDQFVLHYDVSGVSRSCFKTLEARGLSVHFMLDIDGTLYQTLDLVETAWHARQANGRSVGVEIASVGAYPAGNSVLAQWYGRDRNGVRITLPSSKGDGGVRTPNFIGRPARARLIRGSINDNNVEQYDFTPQQYETLAHLAAALVKTFPQLDLNFPLDVAGRVRADVLSDEEFESFQGILGHQHVSYGKIDPGPAFNWSAFARRTAELIQAPNL